MTVLYLCTRQAFPGPPLHLYTSNHSSTLWIFEYCGWDCPELLKESFPYCHCRATEYRLDVHAWLPACPHSLPLLAPFPALEQYVSYNLSSLVALALVGVGLVDCI